MEENTQAPELIPQAVFTDRMNRRARLWRFVLSVLMLVGLCVFAYFTWLWFSPRVAKYGLSILWINGKIAIIVLPFVLLVLLWLFFANLPRKKTSVFIFSEAIRRKHGKLDLILRWDSLESLRIHLSRAFFLGIPGRRREYVELSDAVGNKMALDSRIDHFDELVNLVREKSFLALLTLAQEQLARTGVVSFGKQVSLGKDTLRIRRKALPSSQISSAGVNKGWLKIKTEKNNKFRIRVDKLNNPDVLLHLLDKPS